jgi:hypothetical protein
MQAISLFARVLARCGLDYPQCTILSRAQVAATAPLVASVFSRSRFQMRDKDLARKSLARYASDLAWPLISLLSVGLSLWLLQQKLEAEVSADPVVRAALAEGAFWSDMQVVSSAILDRLVEIPLQGYLFAAAATLVAYAALAWYDRISLNYLGRLTGISWCYVAASSFVAYALGHNMGASVISGGAVRLRAYMAKGLTQCEVGMLVAMTSFTFAYGTLLLLGVVLLFEPQLVAPVRDLMPILAMPNAWVQASGAAMLLLCLLYVLGSMLRLKPLCIGRIAGLEVAVPVDSVGTVRPDRAVIRVRLDQTPICAVSGLATRALGFSLTDKRSLPPHFRIEKTTGGASWLTPLLSWLSDAKRFRRVTEAA